MLKSSGNNEGMRIDSQSNGRCISGSSKCVQHEADFFTDRAMGWVRDFGGGFRSRCEGCVEFVHRVFEVCDTICMRELLHLEIFKCGKRTC